MKAAGGFTAILKVLIENRPEVVNLSSPSRTRLNNRSDNLDRIYDAVSSDTLTAKHKVLLTETIAHVFLRQRGIEHDVPLGIVQVIVYTRIIGIGRHPSIRKDLSNPIEHVEVEVPKSSHVSVEIRDGDISWPEDHLELGTKVER